MDISTCNDTRTSWHSRKHVDVCIRYGFVHVHLQAGHFICSLNVVALYQNQRLYVLHFKLLTYQILHWQ